MFLYGGASVSFAVIMCAVFQRVECPLTHSLPLQRDNKENAKTRAMKKHNSDDLQHLKTGRPKSTSSRKSSPDSELTELDNLCSAIYPFILMF